MSERTNLASLVAAGVTLLAAVAVGMWRRPAHVVAAGLFAGTAIWLIDWITEVWNYGAQPSATQDEEGTGLGVPEGPAE